MNELAVVFSKLLIAELGANVVKKIIAESRSQERITINDYADGNQIYIDAAEALGIEIFGESGLKLDLYYKTWHEALNSGFGLEPKKYRIELNGKTDLETNDKTDVAFYVAVNGLILACGSVSRLDDFPYSALSKDGDIVCGYVFIS
jgi:hypothetical protein